jgi:hypothetical protein
VDTATTTHTTKYTIDPEMARLASSRSIWLSIAERISGSRFDNLDHSSGLRLIAFSSKTPRGHLLSDSSYLQRFQ